MMARQERRRQDEEEIIFQEEENSDEYDSQLSWSTRSADRNDDHLRAPFISSNPQSPGNGDQPQSPGNDDRISHISGFEKENIEDALTRSGFKKFTTPTATRRNLNLPFLIAGFLLVGLTAIVTSRTTVHSAEEQVVILANNHGIMDDQLKRMERDVDVLKREISEMDKLIQQQQDVSSPLGHSKGNPLVHRALREKSDLQKQIKSGTEMEKKLKHGVQNVSRIDIEDKYGRGPHFVEVELIFPGGVEGPRIFVVELAPLEEMPHSVHTFLEMASLGLLDGCSFILKALHVVKAAPLPYNGASAAAKAKSFSEHGLESLAFKEYSDRYPHKQYTLGFAADGSPSFYINTEDNSEVHVGDPCFGKVIEGFDTVRRLEASPTRNGIWFERRIGIRHARILKKD